MDRIRGGTTILAIRILSAATILRSKSRARVRRAARAYIERGRLPLCCLFAGRKQCSDICLFISEPPHREAVLLCRWSLAHFAREERRGRADVLFFMLDVWCTAACMAHPSTLP